MQKKMATSLRLAQVAVRLRPLNAREVAQGDTEAVTVSPEDQHALQVLLPGPKGMPPAVRSFAFHACLGPATRQADVLRVCGLTQLLDAALTGFRVTIMTYGQTGSGKTFTMSGRDSDDGIVTRAVLYLYDALQKGGKSCTLRASYCEIYNEALYDLLHWTKEQLQVRWDAGRGFHVPGLAHKEFASVDAMLNVISRGMQHRRTGSHELNMESSRSHSIMTVYCNVAAEEADSGASLATMGKISFVDLAGSERVKDTKAEKGMLKEASSINKSLFTLGKVISALAENGAGGNQVHVPYRDSKLTKLLMDSLGGSALALMVACCSPAASSLEETLSTLSYATRAKNIRNRPALQVDPKDAHTAALKREVQLLRAENAYLRGQLSSAASLGDSSALQMTLATSESSLTAMPSQRPSTGKAAASNQAPAEAAGGPTQQLQAAEIMLARYGQENERLAAINEALVSRRAFVDSDYTSAMDEVDWLKSRLEHLETSIVSQSQGSRGEPQGRPVSRRGRSGKGGSASEPSDQAQAPALDDPGAGKGVMLETDSPSPNGETGAPVKQSAAPTNARKETEGALESDKIVSDSQASSGNNNSDIGSSFE
ncbi:g7289 [Coccomyxa viridis]|uniref:Kinesin-like protein n=1 Tax=Coccomyxa viridis TaxID=1274662 RepID=A0ABP1G444_9CHLO